MGDGWRRFNGQFRETEWERNERLRKAREKRQQALRQIEEAERSAADERTAKGEART